MLHLTYRYTPHPEGINASDVPDGHGGCDQAAVLSVIVNADGSRSTMCWSVDGKTKKAMPIDDLFGTWLAFANILANEPGLGDGRRLLCETVIELVRDALMREPQNVH